MTLPKIKFLSFVLFPISFDFNVSFLIVSTFNSKIPMTTM